MEKWKIPQHYDVHHKNKSDPCDYANLSNITFFTNSKSSFLLDKLLLNLSKKEVIFLLFKDALEDYMNDCQVRKITIKTYKTYNSHLLHFIKFVESEYGITNIEEVKRNQIKDYVSYLNSRKHKTTYVNAIFKTIKLFFKYLVNEDYLKESPTNKIKSPRNEVVITQTFNNNEIKQMLSVDSSRLNFINIRNKTVLLMLIDTGIRNFELCNLLNSDIRGNIIRVYGKGRKERYVAITPILQKQMTRYERIRKEYLRDKIVKCDNYFLSQTQRPLTGATIETIVKNICNKINVRKEIRCSPHTFRHYFAQTQIKNGLDLYSLSRLLGHHNVSVTNRYLQSISDDYITKKSITTSPLQNL